MRRGVIIRADQPPEIVDLEGDDRAVLAHLRAIIGCDYIESVPVTTDAVGFVDEEGKYHDQPPNPRATRLARWLHPADMIHGPMVVVGAPDAAGRPTDAPDWLIEVATRPMPQSTRP